MKSYKFTITRPLYELALEADSTARRLNERMEWSKTGDEYSLSNQMDEFMLLQSIGKQYASKILWNVEEGYPTFSTFHTKRKFTEILIDHILTLQKIKENSDLYNREGV